jgi:MYXO-CTERM domain-containing protein
MKLNSKFTVFAAVIAMACTAKATVTFNINADLLQTATAGTAAPTSGLVMLVANTSTTGSFGSTSVQAGAPLGVGANIMTNDVILKEWSIGGSSGTAGAFYDTTGALSTSLTTGNPLALLWFPTLTTSSSTATASAPYGIYTGPGNNGTGDTSAAWSVPAAGSTVTLDMYTSNAAFGPYNSPLANSAGVASLTVSGAPEPSRAILAALGMGALLLRRRRR